MDAELTPSKGARALADALSRRGADLDSLDLGTVAEALGEVRRASDALRDALQGRGWGTGLDKWGAFDELTGEDDADGDFDEAGDFEDDEAGDEPPLEGARFSWQARYDFVVTDEQALTKRAKTRWSESGWEGNFDEALDEHGGPLALLLLLDSPPFRGYDEEGAVMAYGADTFNPVERTLDELDPEAGEQAYPLA